MPEQPIRKQDPVVNKSFAMLYVVSMLILMATLFWALWDEDYGQRPWKAFQQEWKQRYGAFLKTAESKSAESEKNVEQGAEYQQIDQACQQAYQAAKPRRDDLQKQILDLNGKILAVQNVFVDKRAYVNALTYRIRPTRAPRARKASGRNSKTTRRKPGRSNIPTVTGRNMISLSWSKSTTRLKTNAPS